MKTQSLMLLIISTLLILQTTSPAQAALTPPTFTSLGYVNNNNISYPGGPSNLDISTVAYAATTNPADGMTVELCVSVCARRGFPYSVTGYYFRCGCANGYTGTAPGNCPTTCLGNGAQECGTGCTDSSVYENPVTDLLSVVDWQYVGCYQDCNGSSPATCSQTNGATVTGHLLYGFRADNTLLSGNFGGALNMYTSVDICAFVCAYKGFAYCGLQGNNTCYCGNAINTTLPKLSDSVCNVPCYNDNTQICGTTDTTTVYSINVNANVFTPLIKFVTTLPVTTTLLLKFKFLAVAALAPLGHTNYSVRVTIGPSGKKRSLTSIIVEVSEISATTTAISNPGDNTNDEVSALNSVAFTQQVNEATGGDAVVVPLNASTYENFTVTGYISQSGPVVVLGNATITGILDIDDKISVNGCLSVSNSATINFKDKITSGNSKIYLLDSKSNCTEFSAQSSIQVSYIDPCSNVNSTVMAKVDSYGVYFNVNTCGGSVLLISIVQMMFAIALII